MNANDVIALGLFLAAAGGALLPLLSPKNFGLPNKQ